MSGSIGPQSGQTIDYDAYGTINYSRGGKLEHINLFLFGGMNIQFGTGHKDMAASLGLGLGRFQMGGEVIVFSFGVHYKGFFLKCNPLFFGICGVEVNPMFNTQFEMGYSFYFGD